MTVPYVRVFVHVADLNVQRWSPEEIMVSHAAAGHERGFMFFKETTSLELSETGVQGPISDSLQRAGLTIPHKGSGGYPYANSALETHRNLDRYSVGSQWKD